MIRGAALFKDLFVLVCKSHREVALISTDAWRPTRPQDGKRTCEHPLSIDVLFLPAFLAHRMPTKQPEIRGSLKGKKRIVFLPRLRGRYDRNPTRSSATGHHRRDTLCGRSLDLLGTCSCAGLRTLQDHPSVP